LNAVVIDWVVTKDAVKRAPISQFSQ